jgi:hypothetical protein
VIQSNVDLGNARCALSLKSDRREPRYINHRCDIGPACCWWERRARKKRVCKEEGPRTTFRDSEGGYGSTVRSKMNDQSIA